MKQTGIWVRIKKNFLFRGDGKMTPKSSGEFNMNLTWLGLRFNKYPYKGFFIFTH